MNGTHQIEPSSTESLLGCLSLAIDEARLVRSIVDTRDQANRLLDVPGEADRLAFMNRRIDRLERELAEVRKRAHLDLSRKKAS